MRTAFCTLAMLALAATAHAEVPKGPDAIHGAFARMLEHEPAALSPASANQGDGFVEHWVNSVARQDVGSLEAGFVHLLERAHEAQRRRVPACLAGQLDHAAFGQQWLDVADAEFNRHAHGIVAILSHEWKGARTEERDAVGGGFGQVLHGGSSYLMTSTLVRSMVTATAATRIAAKTAVRTP